MKKYKISKSNLKEFFGLFGKKKPQTMQQVIDNDPVLKQLDKELENEIKNLPYSLDESQKSLKNIYNYL